MVGVGGAQRKDETATDSGHEPNVPVAVLVNQNSASASEIVAGALKNLDRGVIIGEDTFGKGSVQVLFDIQSPVPFGDKSEDDKLGLKLTTAQYLTPGDVSIQGVGVVPDIETVPMLVQKEGERSWIRLQSSAHKRREADYEWHLDHPSARHGEKPMEEVSYLLAPKPGDKKHAHDEDETPVDDDDDDDAAADDADQKTDFLMEFARDFLAQAKGIRRHELLAAAKPFLDKVHAAEDKKLSQALEKLGVDWSMAPVTAGAPQLALTLDMDKRAEAKVAAGTNVKIHGLVKNVGSAIAYRVRASLESDSPVFDENEMVFGKIAPGESKSYDLVVKVPASSFTRTDVIKGTLSSARPVNASPAEVMLNIEGKARPRFAYTYQTVDDVKGNKDGLVQRGEQVRTLVTVKNIGMGRALHTEAVLRNGTGQEGILITAGRFDAKEMAPGESKTFSFVYEVGPAFKGDEYQLELAVGDTILGESVTDKIKVKVAPGGSPPEAATGTVTVARDDIPLREAAGEGALIVGRAGKGTAFKVTGKVITPAGTFTRVEIEKDRTAFVAMNDVKPGGVAHPEFKPEWQVTPPVLAVTAPSVVTGETAHIKGHAFDDRIVRDVYVRVWNRDAKVPMKKVFYLSNRTSGDRTKLDFEADVPLWQGSNMVQVFARESNEVQSLDTVVVLKRNSGVIAQPAPSGPPKTPTR
jgi:carboxyl-terminal processing protease